MVRKRIYEGIFRNYPANYLIEFDLYIDIVLIDINVYWYHINIEYIQTTDFFCLMWEDSKMRTWPRMYNKSIIIIIDDICLKLNKLETLIQVVKIFG